MFAPIGELRFKSGTCFTFRDLKFYAMNGCICLHDEEDGDFRVLTRREFLERAQAINEEVKRLSKVAADNSTQRSLYELRSELLKAVEDMAAACAEAQFQGDHDDPEVAAWFRKHRPWERSKKRPDHSKNFKTDLPPAKLPRGRFTGRTTGTGDAYPRRTLAQSPQGHRLILPNEFL